MCLQDFQELDVWRRAHGLVLEIYRVSKDLPQSENFGLVLNLRRSVMAMATRIAEGSGKGSNSEFAIELKRSRATGYELQYLLLVSRDLGFMQGDTYDALSTEIIAIRKMTSGLLKRVMAET